MTTDQSLHALYLGLALTLPLSALIARRMPWRQAGLMAGAWIGIFLVAMLAIGLARETGVRDGWARVTRLFGDDEQRVSGTTVRLRMADDGHFWATATIDGVSRRLLIDSGATTTSLSLATARAAGLDLAQSSLPTAINTANGMVFARTSSVHRLTLGPIVATGLRVVVAPEFGDTDILGMNFLSRLKSWHVDGNMLILEPNG